VEPAQASVRFTLELRASGDESLWVDLPEGSFRREFHAESCAEAVGSMAVIAVMVLEAAPAERRAMAEFPATETVASPSPESATSAVTATGAAAPSSEPLPESLPRPLPAAIALGRPASDNGRPASGAALHWAAFAGGGLETAVAPSAPVGFIAGGESWLSGSTWWSPSLRLSLLSTATATVNAADGDATFRLLAGRLAACPFRRSLADWLRLVPCADFEVGSLRAQGGGKALNPVGKTMPWLAPGASLRAELDLSTALSLEVGAGAKWLLRRDTFVFSPSSLVYQVPARSYDLSAAVLVRFL
jgi:hypothetical protein